MKSCKKCNKSDSLTDSNPYCAVCWTIVQGKLLQISPIKVLSVINGSGITYKEIMSNPAIKPHHDKSPSSVGIPLRKLIRLKLVQTKSNQIFVITNLGKTVLSEIKN